MSFDASVTGTAFAEFSITDKDIHDASHKSPWLNGSINFRLVLRVELAPGSLSTSLTISNTHDEATQVN